MTGEIAGILLRGVHLASLASLMGTLVFSAVTLRGMAASRSEVRLQSRLNLLLNVSVVLALTSGIAWFVERATAMADARTLEAALATLPTVALDTRFGQLLLIRGALLLLLPALVRYRRKGLPAILLASGALGLQAATGHSGVMEGANGEFLLISGVLHVLAAGTWLGALVPLLVALATLSPQQAALVLRRFFPLGLAAVSIICATSVVQAIQLVGSIPALVGTAYGRMILVKLSLFVVLLGFAAMNRFAFGAAASLRRSVAGELLAGVMLMLAAGSLAQLMPGVHEQSVWPFAWRINPAPAGPWLIRANPASYFISPTGFAAVAIARGQNAYQITCASCHGASGRGDGELAKRLPTAPADLTGQHLLDLSDGDLYWHVGHRIDVAPNVRWDLVDYLRARNRGEFLRRSGLGAFAQRFPGFSARCADGATLAAEDLRGRVLHIVVPEAGAATGASRTASPVTTIALSAGPAEACLAQPEALTAFAILLGSTPAALGGTEFLIDPNGWLRGRWRPGEAGGWGTPELLLARAQALADRPMPLDIGAQPHRH